MGLLCYSESSADYLLVILPCDRIIKLALFISFQGSSEKSILLLMQIGIINFNVSRAWL